MYMVLCVCKRKNEERKKDPCGLRCVVSPATNHPSYIYAPPSIKKEKKNRKKDFLFKKNSRGQRKKKRISHQCLVNKTSIRAWEPKRLFFFSFSLRWKYTTGKPQDVSCSSGFSFLFCYFFLSLSPRTHTQTDHLFVDEKSKPPYLFVHLDVEAIRHLVVLFQQNVLY